MFALSPLEFVVTHCTDGCIFKEIKGFGFLCGANRHISLPNDLGRKVITQCISVLSYIIITHCMI